MSPALLLLARKVIGEDLGDAETAELVGRGWLDYADGGGTFVTTSGRMELAALADVACVARLVRLLGHFRGHDVGFGGDAQGPADAIREAEALLAGDRPFSVFDRRATR